MSTLIKSMYGCTVAKVVDNTTKKTTTCPHHDLAFVLNIVTSLD